MSKFTFWQQFICNVCMRKFDFEFLESDTVFKIKKYFKWNKRLVELRIINILSFLDPTNIGNEHMPGQYVN